MDSVMEIIRTDNFLLVLLGIMVVLLIAFIVLLAKFSSLSKKYKNFMVKLGDGKNLEEDLETYMYRVDKVEKENAKISNIQKMGMVRYNAFKDVGSDLSFSLALLDENNNGVVLNGIYARETSNIYAKPIKNGKSTYAISEEEAEAIQKAMTSKEIQKD